MNMKKILLLLLPLYAAAQSPRPVPVYTLQGVNIVWTIPPGYTKIAARYEWIAGLFDSTLSAPYGATPSLRTLGANVPGALFFKTGDSTLYVYTGTQFLAVTRNTVPPSWSLTGNSSTTYASNFAGTTDSVGYFLRVNNKRSGMITPGGRTYFGYHAGFKDTLDDGHHTNESLQSSTAFGYYALGNFSPIDSSSQNANAAFGYEALHDLVGTVGGSDNNVAIGPRALYKDSSGRRNNALGLQAMYWNKSGINNVAIGFAASEINRTANNLVSIGHVTNRQATESSALVSVGSTAGNLQGTSITGVTITNGGSGYSGTVTATFSAPEQNAPGFNGTIQATGTVTLSGGAVQSVTMTNIGVSYLSANATVTFSGGGGSGATGTCIMGVATANTFIGHLSGSQNRTGAFNSFFGHSSGLGDGTSNQLAVRDSFNTFMGYDASKNSSSIVNYSTAIGQSAKVGCSNCMVFGATGTNQPRFGFGIEIPAASAIVDITSTSKGVVFSRMTSTQRAGISSPATGLLVFDTDSLSYFQYTGSAWQNLFGGSSGSSGLTGVTTFGSTPNANGLSVSGANLIMQPADGSNPGGVSSTTQSFAGAKTFASGSGFSDGTGNLRINYPSHAPELVSDRDLYIKSTSPNPIYFGTNSAIGFTLSANGNILLGATTDPTATATLGIFNGTAPSASVANGVAMYSEDISSNAELKVRNENGITSILSGSVAGSFSQVGTATTSFTVTFGGTMSNSTYKVNVTPTAALSAALFYVTNKTTTTFDVVYLAGLTGTVTFDWKISQ